MFKSVELSFSLIVPAVIAEMLGASFAPVSSMERVCVAVSSPSETKTSKESEALSLLPRASMAAPLGV